MSHFKPQWWICICILCRNHSHLHAKTLPWANWIVSAETVAVWISGYLSSTCLNDETKQTDHVTTRTSYCTVFCVYLPQPNPRTVFTLPHGGWQEGGKSTNYKEQGNLIYQLQYADQERRDFLSGQRARNEQEAWLSRVLAMLTRNEQQLLSFRIIKTVPEIKWPE